MAFIAATMLVGCHSPVLNHPQTATPPPFRPMLIATLGTHTSSDGTWRVGVSEGSVDLSHSIARSDGKGFTMSGWTTISPQGWKSQAGWFVYIESESRVWAYDGDRKLLLQTETSLGNHSSGATYSSRFPCAVPAEVLSRLSEPARRDLKSGE